VTLGGVAADSATDLTARTEVPLPIPAIDATAGEPPRASRATVQQTSCHPFASAARFHSSGREVISGWLLGTPRPRGRDLPCKLVDPPVLAVQESGPTMQVASRPATVAQSRPSAEASQDAAFR
jgi:hypothetical protein